MTGIQIAQAAPRLEVEGSELIRIDKSGNPREFSLVLDVKNDGGLAVVLQRITIQPDISDIFYKGASESCYDESKTKTYPAEDIGMKIPVGRLYHIPLFIRLPDSCTDTGWRFFAGIKFEGRDQVNAMYEDTEEVMATVPSVKP